MIRLAVGRVPVTAILLVLVAGVGGAISTQARAVPGYISGDTSSAHHAHGISAEGSGRGPHGPRVFRPGWPAGEPTLGVTATGDVFVVAFRDNLRVEVLRSEDEGRSWKVVSPTFSDEQNAHLLSYDPYLYVDEGTDRVFTLDLTIACSLLSFSDDSGTTWVTNPLGCGRPINDRPTLFAGPAVRSPTVGYENIVYYCWSDVVSSSCSKSLDGGLTFAPTGAQPFPAVDGSGALCGGIHGHGVVGADGTVYLPRELCEKPMLAISSDEGATWKRIEVSSAKEAPRSTAPTVDVDRNGNIYFGWVAKDRLPYLAISTDDGMSWSKPVMVASQRIAESNLLALDVGSPGNVAFAYMGTEDDRHPKSWNGYMATVSDALSEEPLVYTASINRLSEPLKRGDCGPGRCGEEILDFIDVVVDGQGRAWGAFVDACDAACERSGLAGGNELVVARLGGGRPLR